MLTGSERALTASGAISVGPRSGGRLGVLSLGDTAFTFSRPGRPGGIRIEIGDITRLAVERRTFVVCAKRVIRLTYQPGRAGLPRSCWMITAQLGDWEAALSRLVRPAHPEEHPGVPDRQASPDLAAALAGLTGMTGLVLDYLAYHGHATTAELLALTGADTEDILLARLQEGFRRLEPLLDGPALRYEGRHFDRHSGAVRQQSWRASEPLTAAWLASRVPPDVFVEDGELLVIVSMPTQTRRALPAVRVDPDGCGVQVRGPRGHGRWIALPEEISGDVQCDVGATSTLVIRARRKACDQAGEDR